MPDAARSVERGIGFYACPLSMGALGEGFGWVLEKSWDFFSTFFGVQDCDASSSSLVMLVLHVLVKFESSPD